MESGDRLIRPEFERRHAAAAVTKAELVEGVVYVASPLRFQQHAEPHSRLDTWLSTYVAFTSGTRSGIEPTVPIDLDNEPQSEATPVTGIGRLGKPCPPIRWRKNWSG
ncbi:MULTISPECIES: hypothetical protein [Cyanophyceae]|uniref:Restriction endonuclease domain-containing protein n=1 Tax=Leptolyngbya subtilissima DQ-A4 TaxID=2933933 RepID=A0ABV0JZI6_9CYAN|nr:hypothetical protein [Nodosilinea sp. FACHB-141]MBD2112293.1 hypothetical protein [Nodosilinea sp. FACHB-141]